MLNKRRGCPLQVDGLFFVIFDTMNRVLLICLWLSGTLALQGQNLLDDEGQVRKFVNIYINDEDIRFLDKLETSVAAGDEVAILPAVAGG